MKAHPAADMFPMMSDPELQELAKDIKVNGQREPVTVLDGAILGGRNREKACIIAGVEPVCEHVFGDAIPDPYSYVITKNIHRRHLTPKERSAIGLKLMPELKAEAAIRMKVGKTLTSNDVTVTASEKAHDPRRSTNAAVAKLVGVSEATIARTAKKAGISKPRTSRKSKIEEAQADIEAQRKAKERAKERREASKRVEYDASNLVLNLLLVDEAARDLDDMDKQEQEAFFPVDWPGIFKLWDARQIVKAYDTLPESLDKLAKFYERIKLHITAWREAHPQEPEREQQTQPEQQETPMPETEAVSEAIN